MGCLTKRLTRVRLLLILFVLTFLVFAVGCTDNNSNVGNSNGKLVKIGKIGATELTEKEESLIKGIGASKFFVFDYSIDYTDKIKVDIWVEYYNKGKYKEDLLSMGTVLNGRDNGQLIISNIDAQDKREIWNISILSGNGAMSSIKGDFIKPKDMTGETWGSEENQQEIYLNQTSTLAVITGGDGQVTGIGAGVYQNDEMAIKELLENDYVYIYKIRFQNLNE